MKKNIYNTINKTYIVYKQEEMIRMYHLHP